MLADEDEKYIEIFVYAWFATEIIKHTGREGINYIQVNCTRGTKILANNVFSIQKLPRAEQVNTREKVKRIPTHVGRFVG